MRGRQIRVLLVDDSRDYLESAADYLSRHPQLQIVGRCTDGEEALFSMKSLHPDLVLTDLAMPGMNGLQLARLLKARPSAPVVVVVSLLEGDLYRTVAVEAGADGFVSKSDFAAELPPLIDSLFQMPAYAQGA